MLALYGWLRPRGLRRQVGIAPGGTTLLFAALRDGPTVTVRMALDDTIPTPVDGVEPFIGGFTVSPDGRQFVGFLTESQAGFIDPIGGGTGKPLPRGVGVSQNVAWGSDGSLWISADRDVDTGPARLSPAGEVTRPFGAATTISACSRCSPGTSGRWSC